LRNCIKEQQKLEREERNKWGSNMNSESMRRRQHDSFYNYNHFMALWILSTTSRVSQYQKGKPNLDFLE